MSWVWFYLTFGSKSEEVDKLRLMNNWIPDQVGDDVL
ncbi:MAG: hypothetical protein QG659_355 [Patescibacteria group bacterium]|nr:hypothetical protein [Patescibacteria group bacterium]